MQGGYNTSVVKIGWHKFDAPISCLILQTQSQKFINVCNFGLMIAAIDLLLL